MRATGPRLKEPLSFVETSPHLLPGDWYRVVAPFSFISHPFPEYSLSVCLSACLLCWAHSNSLSIFLSAKSVFLHHKHRAWRLYLLKERANLTFKQSSASRVLTGLLLLVIYPMRNKFVGVLEKKIFFFFLVGKKSNSPLLEHLCSRVHCFEKKKTSLRPEVPEN